MSYELDIGLQRVALPAVCSLIGCALLVRTDQGEDWFDDEPVKGTAFPTVLGAVLCASGMIASDFCRRGLIGAPAEWSTWKASYQWEWMIWMIPGSMVLLAMARAVFSIPVHFTGLAGTATGAITVGVLYICLNEGAVWDDQHAKLLPWMAASCLAAICNMASLNSIARAGGSRWVSLTVLGQFGCVAAIALQSYASLGELAVVGIGVSLGASLVGVFRQSSAKLHYGWQLSTIVLPLAIMAVACLATSRFFFESHPLPQWLIGLVLFLPTIVGLFDIVVGRITSEWFRVVLAAMWCSLVLGAILYITKPWQSEW